MVGDEDFSQVGGKISLEPQNLEARTGKYSFRNEEITKKKIPEESWVIEIKMFQECKIWRKMPSILHAALVKCVLRRIH